MRPSADLSSHKVRSILAALFALLILLITSVTVKAMSTSDAKEAIDLTRQCNFKLTYRDANSNNVIPGMNIQLFEIAKAEKDFQYSLSESFSSYNIEINKIKAQSEWDSVLSTVSAYIIADSILPTREQTTDGTGVVSFAGLIPGIYLVRYDNNLPETEVKGFAPFLVALPRLGDDGRWVYDVDAFPKPGFIPSLYDNYTVVKEWRDTGLSESRPEVVKLDLYKDGVLDKSIELSNSNNWTYSWESLKSSVWTVVERDISREYTVLVEQNKSTFIVINTHSDYSPPEPPQTGDSQIIYYFIIMCVSGGLLIVIGMTGRIRRRTVA